MLFQYLYTKNTPFNRVSFSLEFFGDFNIELFDKALSIVSNQDPMLRTVLTKSGKMKIDQSVYQSRIIPLEIIGYEKAKQLFEFERVEIDLFKNPILIKIGQFEKHTILLIFWHHIFVDGWSNYVFLQKLFSVYQVLNQLGRCENFPLSFYKNFILYIQDHHILKKNKYYWKQYLSGFQAHNIDNKVVPNISHFLSKEIQLKEKCYQSQEVSLSAVLYAAWVITLVQWKKTTHVAFGTTFSGRNLPIQHIETTIGLFVNTLPMYYDVDITSTIRSLKKQVMLDIINHSCHEHISAVDLTLCINSVGKKEGNSIFDNLIIIENYPTNLHLPSGIILENYHIKEMAAFDIILGIIPTYNKAVIQYNSNLYNERTINSLLESYIKIVDFLFFHDDNIIRDILQ